MKTFPNFKAASTVASTKARNAHATFQVRRDEKDPSRWVVVKSKRKSAAAELDKILGPRDIGVGDVMADNGQELVVVRRARRSRK